MYRNLIALSLVALSVLIIGWPAGQQAVSRATVQPAEPAAGSPSHLPLTVAVVDVGRIFKSHDSFKEQIDQLRQEADEFKAKVAAYQAEIEALRKRLATLKPGSVEMEEAKLLMARLQTELQLFVDRQQKDLLNREATLYSDTYAEISDAVDRYAKANGIRLVLRSEADAADSGDRKSVLGKVNRVVLYQDGLDITDHILKALNTQTADDM